jgi:hypothetical protein
MRLADYLAARRFGLTYHYGQSEHEAAPDAVRNLMWMIARTGSTFVIDEIARSEPCPTLREIGQSCLVPPSDAFIVEYRIERCRQDFDDIRRRGGKGQVLPVEVGFAADVFSLKRGGKFFYAEPMVEQAHMLMESGGKIFNDVEPEHYWTLTFIFREKKRSPVVCPTCVSILTGHHGEVVALYLHEHGGLRIGNDEETSIIRSAVASYFNPALKALQLLSCRNVQTVAVRPRARDQRRHIKRYKRGLIRYKVLSVKSHELRRLYRSSRRRNGEPSLPVHLCRGHVKTYGTGGRKPLFGKLTGNWYWAPQLRGTKSKGLMLKDYEVRS